MSNQSVRRPTLRDVASLAGVSFKTVSRVVNGEPTVSESLAEKVRAAVAELGYEPDSRARYLRSSDRSTKTIGFIQGDAGNPFFSAIFRGLEDVMHEAGYLVLSGSSDRRTDRQNSLLNAFSARRVDGLVMVPTGEDHSLIRREMVRRTPLVLVDMPADGVKADIVLSDHRGGARSAVAHMLRLGHRRVAYMGDDQSMYSAKARYQGYLDAMHAAALQIEPGLVFMQLDEPQAAAKAAAELLERPDRPTAIFTSQNLITVPVVRALHRVGIQHEVAMVGFDDVELGDIVEPGVTVAPQNPSELGRRAGMRLLARMDGDDRPPQQEVLPISVVARGSGEISGPGGTPRKDR